MSDVTVGSTKTRIRFCLLASVAWLSAAPAFGQQYNTLPPNSLVGNFRDQTNAGFAVTIPELISKLSSNSIVGDNHQQVPGLVQGPLSAVQGHPAIFGATPNVLIDGGGISGTGTVTDQKNTASVGLATSGNCDNTTSNTASPCDHHLALNNATLQASPSNPAGTTSASPVMAGLGGTCKLTPVYSGRMFVQFQGQLGNTSTNTATEVQARYGTGNAPANGVAAAGTTIGSLISIGVNPAVSIVPFVAGGIVTGLTPGTAYWLDLGQQVGGGTGTVASISCSAMEF